MRSVLSVLLLEVVTIMLVSCTSNSTRETDASVITSDIDTYDDTPLDSDMVVLVDAGGDPDKDSINNTDSDDDSTSDEDIVGNCDIYFQGTLLPSSPPENEFQTIVPISFSAFPRDPCISPSTGRIIWVTKEGIPTGKGTQDDPVNTINRALDLASNGDAIVIRKGTYYEGKEEEYRSLLIAKPDLILSGYPGEEVVVEPSREGITYGVAISANNIAIRNLTLRNFLYSISIEEPRLQNIVLAGVKINPPHAEWSEGVVVYPEGGENGMLLRGVEISGVGLGVSCNVGPCTNWRLEWVTIRGIPGMGESGADAFAIESGDNILLYKVEASFASGDGIDCKGTNIAIFDSYVHEVDRNAIKLWHNGDIVNCLTWGSGADAAIVFDGGGNYRILNSVVSFHNYENDLPGYTMTVAYDTQEGGNITVDNSLFVYNNGGIYICENFTVQMHNNLFYAIKDGLVLEFGQNRYYLDDGASPLLGTGNMVNVDPLLTDPHNGDMSFSQGPACNGGYNSHPMPPHDMHGNQRIQGNAVDLGPVEYCD